MPALELTPANRAAVHTRLADGVWMVACLCAAWCDVCTEFRAGFDRLAEVHPDKLIVWIDIEDEAEVVGDFDVDNFPTLLIECLGRVTFYGAVEPEARTIDRLIAAQSRVRSATPTACVETRVEATVDAAHLSLLSRLENVLGR